MRSILPWLVGVPIPFIIILIALLMHRSQREQNPSPLRWPWLFFEVTIVNNAHTGWHKTQRRIHALSGAVNATATGERISGSSAANIEWQKRADALKQPNSVLALAMQTPHENSRPPPRDPTTSNRIL